jgi:ATP-binding cassette subfamily B (MDR/TAP) protein 1
LDNFSAVFE